MNIRKDDLYTLLSTAAEYGAKKALVAAGLEKTEINLAEAYRRYSRKNIDAWIKSKQINTVKRGSSIKIQLLDLEKVSLFVPVSSMTLINSIKN